MISKVKKLISKVEKVFASLKVFVVRVFKLPGKHLRFAENSKLEKTNKKLKSENKKLRVVWLGWWVWCWVGCWGVGVGWLGWVLGGWVLF